jgi:chemotaxis protein histidine kinase CheA
MLPSRYRGRYSIIILLSLLVHFTVIVALFWVSEQQEEQAKTEKTVTVTLKKEEPKKEEPKKEEPKKEEPKKEEAKKEEPKKEEAKKEEAKKEEPKKEEPKKEEPKKEEPKKQEAKKQEAKKQEAKKQEAKKQEAKKQEAKKQEAKKQEAKKQEAKKQEAKKQEAKKQEAKKQEAKKQEAKKQEAKKQEAKKQEAKKAEPQYNPYQTSVDVYSQEQSQKDESLRTPNELIKYGSMTMLDDRQMKRAIIYTRGYGNKFQVRQYEGQIIKESLSDYEKQLLNTHLTSEAGYIFSFHKTPKKDGKKYYGEISLLLDALGNIAEITLKLPSGSDALDESVYNALVQAKRLKLPSDPIIRKAMVTAPLTLNYSDEEMAD